MTYTDTWSGDRAAVRRIRWAEENRVNLHKTRVFGTTKSPNDKIVFIRKPYGSSSGVPPFER